MLKVLFLFSFCIFSIIINPKEKTISIEKKSDQYNIYSPSGELLFEFTPRNTDSLSMETLDLIYTDSPTQKAIIKEENNNELWISIVAILSTALLGAFVTLYQTRSQRKTTLKQIKAQFTHEDKVKNIYDLKERVINFYHLAGRWNYYNEITLTQPLPKWQEERYNTITKFQEAFSELAFILRLYGDTRTIRQRMINLQQVLQTAIEQRTSSQVDFEVVGSAFMELIITFCNNEQNKIDNIV